jgi:2-keto-4-pentenoate hydratase/2-oxohepta-3-ene-1,7-dioic acid hydratase in catechol pathway
VRLLSHAIGAEVRLAVALDASRAIDVAALLGDGAWTMERLLEDSRGTLARIKTAIGAVGGAALGQPVASLRFQPPVVRPSKILAVGRNYRAHAAEEAVEVPEAPLLFAKLPSALIGHGETISWSASLSSQVDYEAELGVVIGMRARHVATHDALAHVLGFTCLNDVSARDLQTTDGQWTRAKGLDTFCPLGPWVVTADEIADPGDLRVRCRVNGESRQDASTRELVHDIAELIAHCSRAFTLEPGDIIATGTPGGVGAFRDPPVFLSDGDVIEVEIEGIGTLRNSCRIHP